MWAIFLSSGLLYTDRMCSVHPIVAKKYREIFEEIYSRTLKEITDQDLFLIRSAKVRACDEFLLLRGCAASERLYKALDSPTPGKKNIPQMQTHLDLILKAFRQ